LNTKKKILFIRGSKQASGYYRMALICETLKSLNYTTDIIYFDTLDPRNLIGTKDTPDGPVAYDLTKADVVVFQLIFYEALVLIVQELKAKGIFTIMDTDDSYLNLPRNNPAFWVFHPKTKLMKLPDGSKVFQVFKEKCNPSLDNMKNAMRTVDLLTVSTPELAELYKSFNKNIVVLENCIDISVYDKVKRVINKKPVVIWSGTKTHIDDLYQLSGCAPHNCKLIIGGFTEAKDKGLFKDHPDVTFLEGVSLEDYPRKLVSLGDIVAIPLEDNKFNACKSDIKGLEHAALGIPVIASDVAPYRRWVDHGVNGYLVKKNKTKLWIRYLQQLVDDKELREKLGKGARKKAQERDIRKNIYKWEEVYFNG